MILVLLHLPGYLQRFRLARVGNPLGGKIVHLPLPCCGQ
jgi:hypothetical protein